MISSKSAALGIGGSPQPGTPSGASHKRCQISQQRGRQCAYQLCSASVDGMPASSTFDASALSARFENFILETQHAIIKVTALWHKPGMCLQAPGCQAPLQRTLNRSMPARRRHSPSHQRRCAPVADQTYAVAQETEELDGAGASFLRDHWERPGAESGAGYGITCVLEGGDLLEKVRACQRNKRRLWVWYPC